MALTFADRGTHGLRKECQAIGRLFSVDWCSAWHRLRAIPADPRTASAHRTPTPNAHTERATVKARGAPYRHRCARVARQQNAGSVRRLTARLCVVLCGSAASAASPERAICARSSRGGSGCTSEPGTRTLSAHRFSAFQRSHFPTTGAACIYGVARRPGRSPELAAAVVADKHQARRDVFRGPPRRERVQELNPASESLETMAELEVTDGACRLCGSPTRLVWATVRAEDGRLIERRLLRMVCSSRECLALDVSVRAAEPGGRAADRARS